jgi:hypothetical protein
MVANQGSYDYAWAFGGSMRRFHFCSVALLVGFAQTTLPIVRVQAQVVHLCCTAQDCRARRVKPNLRLARATHLFGVLTDVSGAPFRRSKVELRKWVSKADQVSLKVVETDGSGGFDLGEIAAGQYRFLPSATGAFVQPQSLSCPDVECRLELVLQVSSTDTPDALCPVR